MKTFFAVMTVAALFFLSPAARAQVPVNIVYPIDGAVYPVADIDPVWRTVKSAYVTASFGTTCGGGAYTAAWGFDGVTLGSGIFYDQMSTQLVYKLPAGVHVFWVKSDCGSDAVKFTIK